MPDELKPIVITNQPSHALMAIQAGAGRVMVDLERLGKAERQSGRNTLISDHTLEDIPAIVAVDKGVDVMVRINPYHAETEAEIHEVIARGATHIMLPMFTYASEVEKVAGMIAGRVGLIPLFEHYKAVECGDDVMAMPSVSEVYLGLNDLYISLNYKNIFIPILKGWVKRFAEKAAQHGKEFGFGGIGALGADVPILPELLLCEHQSLGSTRVILSRAFEHAVEQEVKASSQPIGEVYRKKLQEIIQFYQESKARSDRQKQADSALLYGSIEKVFVAA